MQNITAQRSYETFVEAIKSWEPMEEILDEGLAEAEISVIARALSEILQEKKELSMHDKLVLEMEEFLYDVLEEYRVSVSGELLRELVKKMVGVHNKMVHGRG